MEKKAEQITLIETIPWTKEQEDAFYGTQSQPIGEAFKVNEHLYLQRGSDVLHVNTIRVCINTLHVGYLSQLPEKVRINHSEFVNAVKAVIYEHDLDKFWGS